MTSTRHSRINKYSNVSWITRLLIQRRISMKLTDSLTFSTSSSWGRRITRRRTTHRKKQKEIVSLLPSISTTRTCTITRTQIMNRMMRRKMNSINARILRRSMKFKRRRRNHHLELYFDNWTMIVLKWSYYRLCQKEGRLSYRGSRRTKRMRSNLTMLLISRRRRSWSRNWQSRISRSRSIGMTCWRKWRTSTMRITEWLKTLD